jgi:acetylornithine/succinyldiaminopimelate/putrescine aminotransferase
LTQQPGGAVPHATTFGGNPLACASAIAVMEIIDNEGLLDRVTQAGQYLGTKLSELVKEFPGHVTEARGRGLLRGVAVSGAPAQITTRAREKGMLLSIAGANVIRFAPPYIVERHQLDEAVGILREILAEGHGKAA